MKRQEAVSIFVPVFLGAFFELLQATSIPRYRGPDLLLILSCAVGLVSTFSGGLLTGFTLGLLRDLSSGRFIGLESCSMMVASLLTVAMRRYLSPEVMFSRSVVASVSAGAASAAGFLALRLVGIAIDPGYFGRDILLVNAFWAFLLIRPVESLLSGLTRVVLRVLPERRKTRRLGYGSLSSKN